MLYCPKCQKTYEEGTRRFCAADNARLLPRLSAGNAFNQTGGVFANVLSRAAAETGETGDILSAASAFENKKSHKPPQTVFRPPAASRIFKDESKPDDIPENKLPTETQAPVRKPIAQPLQKTVESPVQKPLPRIVRPDEIPSSQAKLGDRKTNPGGRDALTRRNTNILVGQIIKGRYLVTEKIGQSESNIVYLAQDKIGDGKKVLIRILMDEDGDAPFTRKIFAEERVSLLHFNHPNAASVIDSGELPEGKPFIVTEYVAGESVRDMLNRTGQFNALRAARIIRQASYALSAAHQNGILHRSLEPENIILPVSENGVEQVKLTDFGVSKGKVHRENPSYKSSEQLEGKTATAASDVYSLAVIAYQMLTNRLPFDAPSAGALLKLQREGLILLPTNLRLDIKPVVDEILEKALAFNPTARYPKARDFGDAFFNAITTSALWAGETEAVQNININEKPEAPEQISQSETSFSEIPSPPRSPVSEPAAPADDIADSVTSAPRVEKEADGVKATTGLAWEKRSAEPPPKAGRNRAIMSLLGAVVIFSALGLGYYAYNRPDEAGLVQTPPAANPVAPAKEDITLRQPSPVTGEIESPPLSRALPPPPETIYFENSKQALKSEAAKNFLGFSLYYPKSWKQNDAENNFLDISKNAPTGTPIEQMLVSYYDSKGTFKADKELFPALVRETNKTLKSIVPNYKTVSEGEKTVNNGWRAYEVNFEGAGKTAKGESIKLWGRRLFIPAARNGLKNGYVLTMLATSLSPEVKSIEDVGVEGDLHTILYSFEPNQNF